MSKKFRPVLPRRMNRLLKMEYLIDTCCHDEWVKNWFLLIPRYLCLAWTFNFLEYLKHKFCNCHKESKYFKFPCDIIWRSKKWYDINSLFSLYMWVRTFCIAAILYSPGTSGIGKTLVPSPRGKEKVLSDQLQIIGTLLKR